MNVTDDGVPVEDMVAAVKSAVTQSNMSVTDTERDLRITSVRLTLHAVAAATAGSSWNFRLPFLGMKLKIGRSVSKRDTHLIEMTLVPLIWHSSTSFVTEPWTVCWSMRSR